MQLSINERKTPAPGPDEGEMPPAGGWFLCQKKPGYALYIWNFRAIMKGNRKRIGGAAAHSILSKFQRDKEIRLTR